MMPRIERKTPAKNNLKLDYVSTHRDLVEKCKRGNRRAQFELHRLYAHAMHALCMRMVRQEQEAEDLLQESFVDIFTKLHTFKYQSSVGAWMKRIVINNCINHLKRKRLLVEELKAHHTNKEAEDTQEGQNNLPYELSQVKQAVQELPDGYRVVFNLYLVEGYDHKEIGEILGITEATSKSQYSRAKKKLRSMLSKG